MLDLAALQHGRLEDDEANVDGDESVDIRAPDVAVVIERVVEPAVLLYRFAGGFDLHRDHAVRHRAHPEILPDHVCMNRSKARHLKVMGHQKLASPTDGFMVHGVL